MFRAREEPAHATDRAIAPYWKEKASPPKESHPPEWDFGDQGKGGSAAEFQVISRAEECTGRTDSEPGPFGTIGPRRSGVDASSRRQSSSNAFPLEPDCSPNATPR